MTTNTTKSPDGFLTPKDDTINGVNVDDEFGAIDSIRTKYYMCSKKSPEKSGPFFGEENNTHYDAIDGGSENDVDTIRTKYYKILQNTTESPDHTENTDSDSICPPEQDHNGNKFSSVWRYQCDSCSYWTNETRDYNKHLKTKKHHKLTNKYTAIKYYDERNFKCKCGRSYKHRESLYNHKKTCCADMDEEPDMMTQFNSQFQSICNVMTAFMNAQQSSQANQSAIILEQTKALMDVIKTTSTSLTVSNSQSNNQINHITNNTQINDNKSFNLNLFLNETCKNAINLTDFIDEIIVTIADLERTGELGYVGGISSLFIDRLNELDQEDRPMHCSDSKRATLFVRNNNKWEREEIARQLLTKAIKQLAMKSMKKIVEWQKLHPEYNDPESKQNDQYNTIMMNSMSGGTKEESESNYEKIFNNVVKNVVIDKKRIKGQR